MGNEEWMGEADDRNVHVAKSDLYTVNGLLR